MLHVAILEKQTYQSILLLIKFILFFLKLFDHFYLLFIYFLVLFPFLFDGLDIFHGLISFLPQPHFYETFQLNSKHFLINVIVIRLININILLTTIILLFINILLFLLVHFPLSTSTTATIFLLLRLFASHQLVQMTSLKLY